MVFGQYDYFSYEYGPNSAISFQSFEVIFRFKLYSYYAWGFPAVIVSCAHVADQISTFENYKPGSTSMVIRPHRQLFPKEIVQFRDIFKLDHLKTLL